MFKTHFYGQEISSYGRENGYVDYRAFASTFDAVLNNNIISNTADFCYWESVNYPDNTDKIEELEDLKERLTAEATEAEDRWTEAGWTEAEEDEKNIDRFGTVKFFSLVYYALTNWAEDIDIEIEELENVDESEVFQFYIVSDSGAELIQKYTDDPLYYSEELDMYVWGVTHYGTAWDYVLTDIQCEKEMK